MKYAANLWKGYFVVTLSVVLFLALSMGLVELQQRIVRVTEETRSVMVPEIQAKFQLARHIDLMRNYGSLALRTTDPVLRQRAGALAALASAIPAHPVDPEMSELTVRANRHIQRLVGGEPAAQEWLAVDRELADKAERLAGAANGLIVARTTRIHHDAVRMRNYAFAQAAIFSACVALLVLWGRVLMKQMKARNLLFSELSHDFRQRVHGMQLSLGVVGQAREARSHTEIIKALDAMTDLQRYLDNFLDVTRMETIAVSTTTTEVEVRELFQSLALRFEDEADHRRIDLRLRCAAGLPLLSTDKAWLTRMLENLIANALKFARRRVLVAARLRTGGVQFLIVDDGPGMPESHLDAARLQPFVRGRHAQPPRDHGFGLGLAMVRRTARLLGATLRIRAQAGRGTLVQVSFPAGG